MRDDDEVLDKGIEGMDTEGVRAEELERGWKEDIKDDCSRDKVRFPSHSSGVWLSN